METFSDGLVAYSLCELIVHFKISSFYFGLVCEFHNCNCVPFEI